MDEQTVKCPICGEPYHVMAFYAGNQSACPQCIAKANEKCHAKWKPQEGREIK